MRRNLAAAAAALAIAALGVGMTAAHADPDEAELAQQVGFDFSGGEVVGQGLSIPWGLAFLPDGRALVSERDSGTILLYSGSGSPEVIGSIDVPPPEDQWDERGLLGLAVSPNYGEDGYVYAYHSTDEDNRLVRFTIDDFAPEPILTGIPSATNHDGGRLAFGPDGMLYLPTGDADNTANAQDLESLAGKILRVEPDGSVPADNPFEGSPVYSYGHRNVQGLAWGSDGEMYASEFGQDTWDELNHIEAGANYGWPVVEGTGGDPRFKNPLINWRPAEASPSGVEIVDDVAYVGALRGQRLWTVPVLGGEAGEPTAVLQGEIGRIRTVEVAPDGWLWLATSNGSDEDVLVRYPPLDGGGDTVRYEAEEAPAVCDGTIESNHSGYSGSGFCDTPNEAGTAAQFTVTADSTGETTVEIGFANGSSSGARGANVTVNGTTITSTSFENTGGWSTWATKTLTLPLNEGDNTIRLVATGSGGLPNIDYLEHVPPPARYEAEDPPATCDGTIESNHPGYSGTGFCDTPNTTGTATQFTVTTDTTGETTVQIRFANGSSDGARGANVTVNGTTVTSTSFETTGGWSTWATETLTLPLNEGDNTIRLTATGSGGLPNIDYLELGGPDDNEPSPTLPACSPFNCRR